MYALCYIGHRPMTNNSTSKVIPNLRPFLILFFLSIVLMILDSRHLLSLPKQFVSFITNPISLGLYQTNKNIGRQFGFVFQARMSAQENKALKEQLGALLSENAKLRKNLAETEGLVSQQSHLDPTNYNLIPARPIGIQRYLKIDQGSNAGIKIGQAVVFNDNYLGKIINVSEKTSNIQLTNDPDSKVSAFSQGLEGKGKGVLTGQFGSDMMFDKILHEEKINIGDLVYSEGTEGFLPRGLILGKVTQVMERENEVFKQAKVAPNFDIRDLELVFVITE